MSSMYDREAVRPMWEELAYVGIEPLTSAEAVDAILAHKEGTTMIVVNSVCGCAAGGARPGVSLALQNSVIPDRLGTVFAGVDREATQRTRDAVSMLPPSSPCIFLFKDGEPIFALQRHQIETMDAQGIAKALVEAFNENCTRQGPSIPREAFDKLVHAQICGSTLPITGSN